jgi:hypothetical protein
MPDQRRAEIHACDDAGRRIELQHAAQVRRELGAVLRAREQEEHARADFTQAVDTLCRGMGQWDVIAIRPCGNSSLPTKNLNSVGDPATNHRLENKR